MKEGNYKKNFKYEYKKFRKEIDRSAFRKTVVRDQKSGLIERFNPVRRAIEENNIDEALSILSSMSDRGADWHLLTAYIYLRQKRFEEAKRSIDAAKAYEPHNPDCKAVERYFWRVVDRYKKTPGQTYLPSAILGPKRDIDDNITYGNDDESLLKSFLDWHRFIHS
jgi:hypothetical protein